MDTKLTLKLDKKIIERAKIYASEKNISLSKLIENMLFRITDSKSFKSEITPLVESLSGILPEIDFDKDDYADYLDKKYQ
jgi:hypothetical protein